MSDEQSLGRRPWKVVAAGCGIERLPAEVADHAIAVLALSTGRGDPAEAGPQCDDPRRARTRGVAGRGRDALSYSPEEAVDDLDDWADTQVRLGAMDTAERDRVRALVARAEAPGDRAGAGVPAARSRRRPRFTFGLVLDVADVLERHGYPPVQTGRDLVDLQQALYRFLYVERRDEPA